ncbi:MAG: InlB B-repeat-containing protein [Treponema sp.]|nr:InlB B-repeat-containing protein [Treponema sp.]
MKSKREIAVLSTAMTKGLAALLTALALVFTFASCKTESEEETVYRTVTYSTEHATAPEKLTVTDGTALTAEQLPALTESGYTFGGWYDGETKAEAGYKVTKDVTLTAKWTVNTYTVTLNSNGSTVAITATYGKPLPDLETLPTLEGSTFGGYYTEEYAKGTKFIDKDGKGSTAWDLTEDTTLYAAWGYSITYKNTKDVENTNPEIYTSEETVTLANLEKEGYTFTGWYDAETGGNKVESIAQGSTGAKTLYAQWTLITYTITYAGLDGATNPNTATTYTIETDDITLTDASKTGYTFGGWKNANGDAVTKITKGSTGDITLTAQWTTISYNITYEGLNGATNSNPVTYTIETATITLQNPTRTGYTFDGWFDATTDGNKVESIAQGSSGAKTFYARWSLVTYTITYAGLDGATNPNTATSYTIETETITLQKPTKEGYTFTWKNGMEEVTQITKGNTGDITLTGTFTPISYEITYILPDEVANPNPVTYTIETDTITLQDASHEDYTFEGWFDAETGGNKVTSIPKGSTGTKTLYAQLVWKWIGSKSPTTSKTVGDIVFNDGSATPYSNGMTITNEQKAAAIALIFYKGTGLNSGSDTTTRTLGVGLKHNKDKLAWCTESAKAYNINITTIQCPRDGSSFTGDKNGSDNLAQISEFLGDEDDTATAENYPAFYWCINYSNYATNLGADYQTGWYLPTHAELYQIYNNKTTIDTASVALGGNKFETDSNYTYVTSTQLYYSDDPYGKIKLDFKDGNWSWSRKTNTYAVCAIREF